MLSQIRLRRCQGWSGSTLARHWSLIYLSYCRRSALIFKINGDAARIPNIFKAEKKMYLVDVSPYSSYEQFIVDVFESISALKNTTYDYGIELKTVRQNVKLLLMGQSSVFNKYGASQLLQLHQMRFYSRKDLNE